MAPWAGAGRFLPTVYPVTVVILRILYALALFLVLFLVSWSPEPALWDDSHDYVKNAAKMSLAACGEENRVAPDPGMDLFSYIHRNRCALTLDRPPLLPLLIRVSGDLSTFNYLQNGLRAFSWTLLAMTMIGVFPGVIGLGAHLAVVGLALYYPPPYGNLVMTEDLNLSLWLIQFSLLAVALYATPSRLTRAVWPLSLLVALLAILLRAPNLVLMLTFAMLLQLAWLTGREKWGVGVRVLHLALMLLMAAASWYATDKAERYLFTFTNQMNYHLGEPYNPWKRVFGEDRRDRQWFFDHYPELKQIPPPDKRWAPIGHPYIAWQIRHVKEAWNAYVLDHLGDFLYLEHAWVSRWYGWIPYRLGSAFLLASGLWLLVTLPRNRRHFLFLGGLFALAFADFLLALVGDFPGEIIRHTHLARGLFLLVTLLAAFFWLGEVRHFFPAKRRFHE